MDFDELSLGADGSGFLDDPEYETLLQTIRDGEDGANSNAASILSDDDDYIPDFGANANNSDDDDDDDDDDDSDSDSSAGGEYETVSSGKVGASFSSPAPAAPSSGSATAPSPSKRKKSSKKSELRQEMSDLLAEDVTATCSSQSNQHLASKPSRIDGILDTYSLPPLVVGDRGAFDGNADALRPYVSAFDCLAPKAVSERQMNLFRNLLAQHQQLLVQTATVAVRRAIGSQSQGGAPRAKENEEKEKVKESCLRTVER